MFQVTSPTLIERLLFESHSYLGSELPNVGLATLVTPCYGRSESMDQVFIYFQK